MGLLFKKGYLRFQNKIIRLRRAMLN